MKKCFVSFKFKKFVLFYFKKFFIHSDKIILTFLSIVYVLCICPAPELLKPCICNATGISCAGNEVFNLKHIFEAMDQKLNKSEKHFKQFQLSNTAIAQLEENTFYEITFDEIYIYNATKLKLINTNAFNATNLVTKYFRINCDANHCNPSYSTPLINSPPNYDIFNALSSMINLREISLFRTNITEIPSNAFREINGIQNNLSRIIFDKSPISKIGNSPFYDLNNLEILSFDSTPIESIPKTVFNFRNDSEKKLSLELSDSNLNGSSFEIGSFNNLKRPTEINFWNDPIKYLDQHVFQPFIEMNVENRIVLSPYYFDCDDCRSYWLKKDPKYNNRTYLEICSNGKKFTDATNFAKCTEY